jgi:hypothetical protein
MLNLQAFQFLQQYLVRFAATDDFEEKIESIFGTEIDRVQLVTIRQQWLDGDMSTIPQIEIRPRAELNGANGAFAMSTGKIYLAQELVENQTEEVVPVLLEEYGHSVDAQLNAVDAPGDEGELFAALLQGKTLSENDLQTIKTENDWTTINLDGKAIEVEQITFTDIDIAARGLGNDFINFLSGRSYKVIGTSANNTIQVGPGEDLLYGRGGNDTIGGGQNNDRLYGGAGNDIVAGNDESDVLDGGGGQDTLAGGNGNDIYRVSLGSNSAGIVINDLGNAPRPLENVAGGGRDTLIIYKEAFVESPENEIYQTKESYQTVVPVISNTLKKGLVGSQRDGTILIIDLNKDGVIDRSQDLSILNFYNLDGSPGAGYIENIFAPKVVNIATHGFGNGLPLVFPNFLGDWFTLGKKLEELALGNPLLEGQVKSYVSNWDSSTGWVAGLVSGVIGAVVFRATQPVAAGLALLYSSLQLKRAAGIAEDAARTIVNNVIGSGLLSDPQLSVTRDQAIHLVGHSRGAAVNARVATLLAAKGYKISQYTSLDGYSTDWPGVSGLLGDISITTEVNKVKNIGKLEKAVNYQVQNNLTGWASDKVFDLIKSSLGAAFSTTTRDLVKSALFDSKAPDRPGLKDIPLVAPTNDPLTDHLNITPYYIISDKPSNPDKYILNDYQYVISSLSNDSLSSLSSDTVSTFAAAAISDSDNNYGDFADGTFEELGSLQQQVASTIFPVIDDAAVQNWIAQIKDPAQLVSSIWDVSGNVKLVREGSNTLIELSQTNDTSLGQLLNLSDNPKSLEFDLSISAVGADDKIQVVFKGNTLKEFVLGSLPANGRYSVPLSGLGFQSGKLTFRLIGPTDAPSTVRLDNLSVLIADNGAGTLNSGLRNDFNGDKKSDILWRNDYGSVALWQMDGATVTSGNLTSAPDLDPSWKAAGTGDFNGDGKSDVLWRNTDGNIAVWAMNGAAVTSSTLTSTPSLDNSWTTVGTGDYNGDGKSDILWRNTNGAIAVWTMDGTTVTSSSLTSTPSLANSWKVAGNSDFDGDGKADILWRNDDGSVALWQMNGAAITAATAISQVATDWKIAGTGDFNNDAKADILWRNDDGRVSLWQMNGAAITAQNLTSTPARDSSQTIAGIGDYSGDGKADILWSKDTGATEIWQMNGSTVVSSTLTSVAADSSNWKIAAPII